LHVKQGWGEAQVSGVIHNVNVKDYNFNGDVGCGEFFGGSVFGACDASEQKVGWGIDAGVKYNLNWWGAGDSILVTGSYTQNAVWYLGLPDGMWGENGQVNGNGQPMYLADAFFNPLTNQWSTPRAWSVTAIFEHHFTPQFYVDLEGSVGGIEWSNMGGGCNVIGFGCGLAQFGSGALSPHATSWIIGADLGWNPVTNLNFDLELMYQDTTQERPSGFIGTVFNNGEFVPGAWQGNSNGFAGRFRITRYF
jgi:Porin subfamily